MIILMILMTTNIIIRMVMVRIMMAVMTITMNMM